MALKSPKVSQWLGVPYPDEECDPFFDQFEAMVQGFESAIFFRKLFDNAVFGGGGTRTWNPGTGLFTWTADFTLMIPHWGLKANVRFGPDGVTRAVNLADGQIAWLRVPQGMTTVINLDFRSGSQLVKERHDELVCLARIGSALHMRSIGEVS